MDALDLIKSDHQRMQSLFEQFRVETGRPQQLAIFEKIKSELDAHSRMEEEVFYPAFKNYPDFKEILEHSYRDHREAKALAEKIRNNRESNNDFETQAKHLIREIDQHMSTEENEFFPLVRKTMRRPERERLGRHMQSVRQAGTGVAA